VVSHVAQGRRRSDALADTQQFYRLYMVPGLAHCSGGNGVNTFDVQAAMEGWVERGVAPGTLPATRTVKGVVERSRPLCVYPEVAVYDGRGNVNDAASFSCRRPAAAR
jgi:feruloyl esterase